MIINNKKEFEEFYPYEKKYIEEYPKEYLCVVKSKSEGGGISGYYEQVYVAYYPKNLPLNKIFEAGLFYEWEPIK